MKKQLPLVEYYKSQDKHFGINGMGTIDDIKLRLKEVLRINCNFFLQYEQKIL